MTASQRVLVPLDGSELAEAAIPYAEAMARALGISLHLLAVAEREPGGIFALDQALRGQLEQDLCVGMADYLQTVAQRSRERGIDADTETVVGHPAEEILAVAGRLEASMVVMATHGRGGVHRAFLGSVADKVMRTGSHPTLLISPGEHRSGMRDPRTITLHRIAVPLDGSPVAEAALGLAGTLAAATGSHMLLLRVQALPLTSTLAYAYIPELDTIETDLERDAQQYLDGLRPRLPAGVATETAVLRGVPAAAMAEYMGDHTVDLVVMTTHGYGGLQRLLMGSTADRLVRLGFRVLLLRTDKQHA